MKNQKYSAFIRKNFDKCGTEYINNHFEIIFSAVQKIINDCSADDDTINQAFDDMIVAILNRIEVGADES